MQMPTNLGLRDAPQENQITAWLLERIQALFSCLIYANYANLKHTIHYNTGYPLTKNKRYGANFTPKFKTVRVDDWICP